MSIVRERAQQVREFEIRVWVRLVLINKFTVHRNQTREMHVISSLFYLGPKMRKQDMKRRLAELDLTNQRPAQLRSISGPYIRVLGMGKQQCRNHVAWVCATTV